MAYDLGIIKRQKAMASPIAATGGIISTVGSSTIHTFTSSGVFRPLQRGGSTPLPLTVSYLVVAGGGGGGVGTDRTNGGGGAGGLISSNSFVLSTGTSYTVTVGAGGVPGSNGTFSRIALPNEVTYSGYFNNSTSDVLKIASNAAFAIGTSNFTVEGWFNSVDYTHWQHLFHLGGSGHYGIVLYRDNSNDIIVQIEGSTVINYAFTPTLNTWYHFALVRAGTGSNQTTLYLNGVSVATGTSTGNISADNIKIGGIDWGTGNNWSGYISNVRLVNGTAVYTGAFTPPTSVLTSATTGTVLLTLQDSTFIDNSGLGLTVTTGGSPTTTSTVVPPLGQFAYGGGAGGGITSGAAAIGGSGGGAKHGLTGAVGISGQGQAGGTGYDGGSPGPWTAGGGGGKGGVGGNGSSSKPGDGGAASSSTISGSVVYYAGGGGGGFMNSVGGTGLGGGTATTALKGGGGDGNTSNVTGAGSSGTANTGGGGGGSGAGTPGYASGTGGSGVVIISYPNPSYTSPLSRQSDPYFNKTSILLSNQQTTSANSNTSFIDSSANALIITPTSKPSQGTFSPFGQNWSNYFNGSTDYLTIPYKSAFDIPSSTSVSFEAWVHTSSSNTFVMACRNWSLGSGGPTWGFSLNSGVTPQWNFAGTGSATYILAVSAISGTLGQWNHYAFTRDASNVCRIFVNGVLGVSRTDSSGMTSASGSIFLGTPSNNANYATGYMSNVRLVVGSAIYTSDFTPPTAPLPIVTNTSLLTCASSRFMDKNSTSTVTASGTPSVQRFSPFNSLGAYNSTLIGGSAYFNGSSDYLSVASSNNFAIGTGIFTFEAWVYPTAVATNASIFETAGGMQIGYQTSASFGIAQRGVAWRVTTSTVPTLNAWNHVAIVRSGTGANQTFVFINGVLAATGTNSDNYGTTAGTAIVGAGSALFSGGGGFFNSYISNLRFVNGTALYTSTFTPPAAPVVVINTTTSTSLLLNCANAGIYDATAQNQVIAMNTASLSSSVVKYNTRSMYFNGITDYLNIPHNPSLNLSTGSPDFTIEFWMYVPVFAANKNLFAKGGASGSRNSSYSMSVGASGNWQAIVADSGSASTYNVINSAANLSAATWYHIAMVRYGNTLTVYSNGVSIGTTAISMTMTEDSGPLYIAGYPSSGQYTNVYFDDFRITKGVARYTAAFTPPTQPPLLR